MRSLIAVLLLAAPTAAAQTFPLDAVLAAPFPSEILAAPKSNRVAWIVNAKGVRNIWVAEGPSFTPRQLTKYSVDDGQEIGSLAWSPDASTLVFVRGGAANRSGEIPNPTSDPVPPDQAVWSIPYAGGEPKKIGEGSSPEVSPKGDRVVWSSRGQLMAAPLDGSARPAALFRMRGAAAGMNWSPDGSRIAVASNRGDHSFIAVYDLNAKSVRFLDPGVDRDTAPVWSPDGKQIAFLRMPAEQRVLPFGPRRSAAPWSIRVADVESGKAQEIWRAQPNHGSVFQNLVAAQQMWWTASGKIVFPWERTGWKLLYAVPARGGETALLTPGKFEVEYASLTPDAKALLINSNQDDIDRRHLWRVSPDSGSPELLTPGKGIEWAPTMLSDGQTIAFLRSDARTPAHAAIRMPNGEVKALMPVEGFPSKAFVEPQAVMISAADGMQIPAQLFLPANHRPGQKHPAVVFFHGGSRRQMLLGYHYGSYYHNAYSLNQFLASRGYIVLSVNYRSGTGYGMEFREALNYGATGASEYQDVIGAGLYLRGRPDVEPNKIGLWGGSYGGYLTAMGLSRASDLFAAGVDIHGVHEWNAGIRTFVPDYNPRESADSARVAYESSPIATVNGWRSPVLLIHGDDDRNVAFSQTVRLVEELRRLKVEHEIIVFPDEVHSFLLHRNWVTALQATANFFDRKLKN